LGQPGVECHVQHESGAAVKELIFLVNEVNKSVLELFSLNCCDIKSHPLY